MGLSLYNSLTRRIEPFEPADPEHVTVYGCGPTVYNHVHIGNWASFLFYDVLVRWLRASGYGVEFVVNITDVEDKIIRDSRAAGEERAAFARRWEMAYREGIEALGCVSADHYPHATEHIDGMVQMIQTLLDSGHAYVADEEGSTSIYYRVASFDTYGELANLSKSEIKAGASGRVKADEYEKENVGDFALWKGWTEGDGDVFWQPRFGVGGEEHRIKGRPGWHIECSVMSTAFLGNRIDLHLGGEDLRFPHHQNEIAQTEAATGESPFVRTWMHRRHLLVEGRKMSKSAGNFYTLQDVVERAGPSGPRGFRYLVVSGHYRKPIDFSWSGLDAALQTLRNLHDAHRRLTRIAGDGDEDPSDFADASLAAFRRAMDGDLETAGAMAAVHELLGEANRRAERDALAPADARAALELLALADAVLGFGLGAERRTTPEQEVLLAARDEARAARDWAASDRLRDELRALGIEVKDSKDGQEVTFL
jgi:cysteinyl-tRNA synthetase